MKNILPVIVGLFIPDLTKTAHPLTDYNTNTCFNSRKINPANRNNIFDVTMSSVNSKTLKVQLITNRTLCNNLAKVLYTTYRTPGGCKYYKTCKITWGCSKNKICEYQCYCNGTGTCELSVMRLGSVDDWDICDIRV